MLYFLHIPKTAGLTLARILESHFAPAQICPAQHWHELLKIPPSRLKTYHLLRGHFYHHVQQLIPQQPVTLTFLRDPIERSLSHYGHIRRSPQHYLNSQVQAGGVGECLGDPALLPMIADFQTRAIGLDLNPVEMARSLSPREIDAWRLEQMIESVMPPVEERDALLQRAKQRLNEFAFVGLTERFEDSVELLAWTLGWEEIRDYRAVNIAPARPKACDLPESVLSALREHLQLDYELYSYGQQLFEARFAEMRRVKQCQMRAAGWSRPRRVVPGWGRIRRAVEPAFRSNQGRAVSRLTRLLSRFGLGEGSPARRPAPQNTR